MPHDRERDRAILTVVYTMIKAGRLDEGADPDLVFEEARKIIPDLRRRELIDMAHRRLGRDTVAQIEAEAGGTWRPPMIPDPTEPAGSAKTVALGDFDLECISLFKAQKSAAVEALDAQIEAREAVLRDEARAAGEALINLHDEAHSRLMDAVLAAEDDLDRF